MENLNDQTRLARVEAIAQQLRSEMDDVQRSNLEVAIGQQDEETAAEIVRAIRDKLLNQSDAHMAIDRLQLNIPTGSTFAAWLGFFQQLGAYLKGDWAQYRQALRDITAQPGFPFSVEWPEAPEE